MSISNSSAGLGTLDLPVFTSFLTAVVGIIALCVNVLVAFAYITDRGIRRVPVNFVFFNLSISDGMTGINLLNHFIWIQQGANLLSRYNVLCILWGGWGVASVLSSALLVILISWDRLKMVTDPFKYRQLTRRRVAMQVFVLWIYVLSDVIVLLLVAPVITKVLFNHDILIGLCNISSIDSQTAYFSVFIDFLIPLTVLIVINGMIAVRIRLVTVARIERQRLEIGSTVTSTSEEANVDIPVHVNNVSSIIDAENFQNVRTPEVQQVAMTHYSFRRTQDASFHLARCEFRKMHKTIKLLLLFVFVYIMCWFPFYAGLITRNFIYVTPWVMQMLTLLVGLNAVINPFLYPLMSNKYRDRLALMLHPRLRQ
ncbi:5-hydroxytryptamine receptor 1A-alpha [Holothuria leucospilota]|uniref:5-hydroxytryptamine receptor 1A-alpha n=1 Tax=Holothuria leucospilota TaxID=206669 RepID=A0A9Q1HFM7_HOLLE|nr:5-hydroxytryptamine receptor 1A-alpha [Holothuria leucospilota]